MFSGCFPLDLTGPLHWQLGAEYCQTTACHHEILWVPQDGVTSSHVGKPIAFIISDFCFLTSDETIVSPIDDLHHPACIIKLQICFHFDKSPINGHCQKFRCTGHGHLCPVLAGLSIVQCAIALQVPSLEPLRAYAGCMMTSLAAHIPTCSPLSL